MMTSLKISFASDFVCFLKAVLKSEACLFVVSTLFAFSVSIPAAYVLVECLSGLKFLPVCSSCPKLHGSYMTDHI